MVWHGRAWVVPQFGQPRFDRVPARHGRKQCRGQPLLCLQPGVRFWSLRVFQPAIGIGDERAMVVVDHRISAGRGIEELWGCWVRMVGHWLCNLLAADFLSATIIPCLENWRDAFPLYAWLGR